MKFKTAVFVITKSVKKYGTYRESVALVSLLQSGLEGTRPLVDVKPWILITYVVSSGL